MSVTINSVPVSSRLDLLAFLKDWDAWAKGKPYQKRVWDFRDCGGLCLAWDRWPKTEETSWRFMSTLFRENGLDGFYPFNGGDRHWYRNEKNVRRNPRRRAFVRDAIAALEAAL